MHGEVHNLTAILPLLVAGCFLVGGSFAKYLRGNLAGIIWRLLGCILLLEFIFLVRN